eukprot:scaffold13782_cov26-Tisochrysis_lutea.AAC.1
MSRVHRSRYAANGARNSSAASSWATRCARMACVWKRTSSESESSLRKSPSVRSRRRTRRPTAKKPRTQELMRSRIGWAAPPRAASANGGANWTCGTASSSCIEKRGGAAVADGASVDARAESELATCGWVETRPRRARRSEQ